jgi:hypothetical protein
MIKHFKKLAATCLSSTFLLAACGGPQPDTSSVASKGLSTIKLETSYPSRDKVTLWVDMRRSGITEKIDYSDRTSGNEVTVLSQIEEANALSFLNYTKDKAYYSREVITTLPISTQSFYRFPWQLNGREKNERSHLADTFNAISQNTPEAWKSGWNMICVKEAGKTALVCYKPPL